ncbi:MAG: DUF177 domain-containing protein [Verrucomicrobium sp.]
MSLKIDPRSIPQEGLHVEGTLPVTIFALSEEDSVNPLSPLAYDLTVMRDENDLLIHGQIGATFELTCGRCAERYQTRMELQTYGLDVQLENEDPIDLTIYLREDILLALPTYPRCETGNVAPRDCPAEGKFNPETEPNGTELDEAADRNVWESLDQLNNLKRN